MKTTSNKDKQQAIIKTLQRSRESRNPTNYNEAQKYLLRTELNELTILIMKP